MKYLTIGEKQRPIYYGWGGLELFEELTGVNALKFEELQSINMKQTRLLVYAGFVNGAETAGQDVDFDKKDVIKWLNEDLELLEQVMIVLLESMPGVKKKKQAGKKQPN